jgi:hypothetical protein
MMSYDHDQHQSHNREAAFPSVPPEAFIHSSHDAACVSIQGKAGMGLATQAHA